MTATLAISEIIEEKKATERAIAKLLADLQEQTGCLVTGITTTKLIGPKDTEIKVQIVINL